MAVLGNLNELVVGPASDFRNALNDNFDMISTAMVDVQLSTSQPVGQKTGDFWFKDISTTESTGG